MQRQVNAFTRQGSIEEGYVTFWKGQTFLYEQTAEAQLSSGKNW